MKTTSDTRPAIHIESSYDDVKMAIQTLASLIKDANLDLNIHVKLNNDEHDLNINETTRELLNGLDGMIADDYVPSIVIVGDEGYTDNETVNLTEFMDSFFSIRACLHDVYSFDLYDDLHQEPFAGKKEEFGKFSIKHNRKKLQKDARFINKQNRSRRFSGKR